MSHLLALYMGSLILRSIGIALVAGICSWKIRNVALRHAIWVGVLGSMLLMPAVDYLLPPSWVPARIQQIAAEQPVSIRIASPGATVASKPAASAPLPSRSHAVDWWSVAAALYALVTFAMFVQLATGYRKMRKLRATAKGITSLAFEEIVRSQRTRRRMPVLLESEAVQVPMTVGFCRPAVILPADWKTWDDWKMRAVLFHEIAHIRRIDWCIAVIAAAVKCAYWLNPLSWFLERKLSQLAEQASDDASLYRTQNVTRYAEILLEFAAATQNGGRLMKGGVAMAHYKIQERIERVLARPQSGTGSVKIAGWILVTLVAAPVIYTAAALQVTSEAVKVPSAAYAAEFGGNPLPQTPAAAAPAAPTPAPAAVSQAQQKDLNPADILSEAFQTELENRTLQRQYEDLRQKLAQAQAIQASLDQAPDLQQIAKISGSVAFLQDATHQAELRLIQMLQTEVAVREKNIAQLGQQIGNQPNPNQSQLDQLHANEEALERYKADLSRIDKQIEEKLLTSSSSVDSNSKNRIFVTGRVQRPGVFHYDKPLTVLQALALAGGFQEYAKTDAISIVRMNGDSSTLFRFTYPDVIKGVNNAQNIYLESGDVVVVP